MHDYCSLKAMNTTLISYKATEPHLSSRKISSLSRVDKGCTAHTPHRLSPVSTLPQSGYKTLQLPSQFKASDIESPTIPPSSLPPSITIPHTPHPSLTPSQRTQKEGSDVTLFPPPQNYTPVATLTPTLPYPLTTILCRSSAKICFTISNPDCIS